MDNPVIIFGATSIGRATLEIFQSRNILTYCFLDDDIALHQTEIDNVLVLGSTHDEGFLKLIGKKCEAFVAVEEIAKRREIIRMLIERRKVMPVNAIHDKALLASSVSIGHGNFINAGAILNAGVQIGNHCLIHSCALVDTNAILEDYVVLGTGSIVNSGAVVGEGATIGSGVIIAAGVKI
ncbi:MAG: acetyltransferase, partial [Flammeovirgaceae bacterium]|nr:acetyltransferase [Flammeovirgaceae bacterium]MDW8288065.1 acetyltransferase [Flammeovirgaceae bacterium]